jgi:hypothetical protein
MGRVSLRRETIFRDWAVGSSSSRDLWIVSSSSRVASSLSIRRLIVCGNLLDRRMLRDTTLFSAESRYASGHARTEIKYGDDRAFNLPLSFRGKLEGQETYRQALAQQLRWADFIWSQSA